MASAWNARTIYAAGDTVTYAGGTFNSLQDYNLNQIPTAIGSEWWLIAGAGAGVNSVTAGTNITVTGTAQDPVVNAAAVAPSPAGAYAFPTSVTVDAYGRTTAVTAGAQPVTAISTSAPLYTTPLGPGSVDVQMAYDGTASFDIISPIGDNPFLALKTLGAPVSINDPGSVSIDAFGRVTAASATNHIQVESSLPFAPTLNGTTAVYSTVIVPGIDASFDTGPTQAFWAATFSITTVQPLAAGTAFRFNWVTGTDYAYVNVYRQVGASPNVGADVLMERLTFGDLLPMTLPAGGFAQRFARTIILRTLPSTSYYAQFVIYNASNSVAFPATTNGNVSVARLCNVVD